MKKVCLSFLLFSLINPLFSQTWFDVGIKAGATTAFWYNKQFFDNQYLQHNFKISSGFGAKIGFNFVQEHQLTFDVFSTGFRQGFSYHPEGSAFGEKASREFGSRGTDLLFMYRSNRNGTYFEVGPVWTFYKKVTFRDTGTNPISPAKIDDLTIKKNFGLVAGLGGYIFGTDNFGVTTGLRFSYMFYDLANANGRNVNFPFFTQANSDPTNLIGIMFVVEMNYDFGYLVSPRCGQRSKLFVF